MIRIFSHYVSKLGFLLLTLELLILLVAASLTSVMWLASAQQGGRGGNLYLSSAAFAVVIIFSMSALGMYQQRSREAFRDSLLRIMPSFALGFALLSVLIHAVPGLDVGAYSVIFLLGGAGVLLIRLVVLTSARSKMMKARLLLVGSGALALECIALATSKLSFHQFTVVGCTDVPGETRCVPASSVLAGGGSLLEIAQQHNADEIVVSVADRRGGSFPVRELLDCALGGVRVIDAATFFEREACQIRLDSLQPSYLIFGGGFDQGFVRATSKRLFDLLASGLISLLALPVMLVAALAVWLEDGGPVLYRQERVGLDGRVFPVLKFRSMRSDAEKDGRPIWALTDDPRITRVGRLLRKLRIDELPQMINVMRGEMSFVGPRPERAFFVDQLSRELPYYGARHSIKPGVTGLAQVRYQYGASVDDAMRKLQYDLYYVKNNSLFLDLLILIETVQVVLFGKGSR
jgi:sugar transferase (PEP-CTERM system associated)